MPKVPVLTILIVLISNCIEGVKAQIKPAGCIQRRGLAMLSDAILGSVGACNCERSGVYLRELPTCNPGEFELFFSDEFDGDSLDLSKWQNTFLKQGALENQPSLELSRLENVSVANGICKITARKETVLARAVDYYPDDEILEDGKKNLRNFYYTAAHIWSRQKFLHGKYEIRCRLPKGESFWPAFWTFGGERWNEIDIFDAYHGTNELISSIGHDFDANNKAQGCSASLKGYDMSEWHTYACVFDNMSVTFYVDNNPVRVINRVISISGNPVKCGDEIAEGMYFQLKSFPVEPMHVIFSHGVISKNGPGNSVPVDENTPFPSVFEVDYIRYWKVIPEIPSLKVFEYGNNGTFRVLSDSKIKNLTVRDITGLLIHAETVNSAEAIISLAGKTAGVYFFSASFDNSVRTVKVMKTNN